MEGYAIAVITGLIAGIGLIAVLGIIYANQQNNLHSPPHESIVIIPKDIGLYDSNVGFEPQNITVKLGVNNTVKWVNHDRFLAWIWADNQTDPDFFRATQNPTHSIMPNQTFAYTFAKSGTFGYHYKPWLYGSVVVVP